VKKAQFISEASVYRLLRANGLLPSPTYIVMPAYIVMKAADEFKDKTTAPNQLWQTDFTYLKVIGWGWLCLSMILADFSRFIVAWKICTTMKAADVRDGAGSVGAGWEQAPTTTAGCGPSLIGYSATSLLSREATAEAEWPTDCARWRHRA
jgi:putative transposase